MTSNLHKTRLSTALASLLLLAACGGGGGGDDSSSTTASAEGVYGGSVSGSVPLDLQILVLDNGDVWTMYGLQASGQFLVAGFFEGSSTSSDAGFRSTDLRDYFDGEVSTLTMSASLNTATGILTGNVADSDGSANFSAGPIAGSLYRYDTPALPATVQGDWSLTTLEGEATAVTVAADGTLAATGSSGCRFTGSVVPRPSGKNVYNVSLSFGPAPCALANRSASGIALAYPLATGSTQLLVAVRDGTRSVGTAAFGTR